MEQNFGPIIGHTRKGCAQKGLREEVNKDELRKMKRLVETNYGSDGPYELKSLDTAYNPQYNVIRSREWDRVVKVMIRATKRGATADVNGHTWEGLGTDLLAFLKRVQRVVPNAIPDFAVKDCQSVCYFALAVVQLRKKNPEVIKGRGSAALDGIIFI